MHLLFSPFTQSEGYDDPNAPESPTMGRLIAPAEGLPAPQTLSPLSINLPTAGHLSL